MRIFLSFASEQKALADAVALALRESGNTIFFSQDDLPPGDSFDVRIQKAIEQSDLMVFLISPEAITKGRYTLTELAFARDRWPTPRGRVLPVIAAPTPVGVIPPYLKAVTILAPEGNIAAETRAAVEALLRTTHQKVLIRFALVGLFTGLLSWLDFTYFPKYIAFSFLGSTDRSTIVPGVFFGLAVASCGYLFGVRDRFLLLVVVVMTVVAWILAYDTAYAVGRFFLGVDDDFLTRALSHYPSSSESNTPPAAPSEGVQSPSAAAQPSDYAIVIAGIVGGLVGGIVTMFGISIADARMRTIESWSTTCGVAAVFGCLLSLGFGVFPRISWLFPLFTTWQAAVLVSIARGMILKS
jgi:hypothetical protein